MESSILVLKNRRIPEKTSEREEENVQEEDIEFQGAVALDMFIDPLNPQGKAVHQSLKTKIQSQVMSNKN